MPPKKAGGKAKKTASGYRLDKMFYIILVYIGWKFMSNICRNVGC